MQWTYHGKNREKTVIITADSIIVLNKDYETFELFHDDIDSLLKALFDAEKDLTVSRLGLRYVNVIDISDKESPVNWNNYVDQSLLGVVDKYSPDKTVSRIFHIVEFNDDGNQIKFQYGIPNPDYPAPIKKNQFVLDIDAYFNGALVYEDTKKCIDMAHGKIQDIFEKSITKNLRDLMGGVTE